jgi:hypothetical protein
VIWAAVGMATTSMGDSINKVIVPFFAQAFKNLGHKKPWKTSERRLRTYKIVIYLKSKQNEFTGKGPEEVENHLLCHCKKKLDGIEVATCSEAKEWQNNFHSTSMRASWHPNPA